MAALKTYFCFALSPFIALAVMPQGAFAQSAATPHLPAGRFLEQASFGPTGGDIAHLEQIGVNAWLTEQFAMAETPLPVLSPQDDARPGYLYRFASAPDQLRQRVAYALGQIFVISSNKNNYADEVQPYLQILSHDAFGNYRTLLGDISVSSQMGHYLDLAGSTNVNGGGANENFAREVMQLFSIGVRLLNPDGSLKLDANGNPIPTYDPATIAQVARALTGWVYLNNAWQDFTGPMVPWEANHDTGAKAMLGCTLGAGQNTAADMNGFLDCLFNHPNVPPFVATRLIRSMVTSNPSPAYIQRVSAVFADNGAGVRGDLQAVVRAVLTDPEARNDTAASNSGRLKDPIFHILSFVRALNGTLSPTNNISWFFDLMGESPLTAPSVFGFYSPLFQIPQAQYVLLTGQTLTGQTQSNAQQIFTLTTSLHAPEFQIYTPTESVERANFLAQIVANPGSDITVDLSPFVNVAADTTQLINLVDQTLLYGRMPPEIRQSIANAVNAQVDNPSRVQAALYLAALSGHYAIQY